MGRIMAAATQYDYAHCLRSRQKNAFKDTICLLRVTRLGFNLVQIVPRSVRIVPQQGPIQVVPSGQKCQSHRVVVQPEVALVVMMVAMCHSLSLPFPVCGATVQETAVLVATSLAVTT